VEGRRYFDMKKYAITVLTVACLMMAGCSQKSSVERTSQKFNSMPQAVQKTVRSYAPAAEIASINTKTRNNMTYYVIEFKEPGRNPKLTVAQNGTVITPEAERAMGSARGELDTNTGTWFNRKEPGSTLGAPQGTTPRAARIDLSALPLPVQKTLKSEAPNATIEGISRHDENGRVIYEFEFEDKGKNPTMRIAEDGTVVQSLKK